MKESQCTPPTLSVCGVSKEYDLYSSLGARFIHQMLGPLSPVRPRAFPAMSEVSFDLHRGEAIAVLGRNGAGKSTLLQIIAGLVRPTTGSVVLPRRIAGLLELGSGFNPDFSGRENVWINAAILGLTREETRARLDDIIGFADIGDYLDQPVRTYSSGMFLRLAFAVATAAAPDLLLVDEVLAVGDIFFRQKCYERLGRMRQAGAAVVLVTHALSDAAEFCNRGIVLSNGHMAFSGNSVDAVQYYLHNEGTTRTGVRLSSRVSNPGAAVEPTARSENLSEQDRDGTNWIGDSACVDLTPFEQIGDPSAARVDKLLVTDVNGQPARVFRQGQWMRIYASFTALRSLERAVLGIAIRNDRNILVHGKNGINVPDEAPTEVSSGTRLDLIYEVKLDVEPGEYTLDLGIAELPDQTFACRARLAPEELAGSFNQLRFVRGAGAISVVLSKGDKLVPFSHYGLADLAGRFTAVANPASPTVSESSAPSQFVGTC